MTADSLSVYAVLMQFSAVSTHHHYARQVKATRLCHGQEQLALIHEAFQSLVRKRGTVCHPKWRRHHWHSDSSPAS